MLVFMTADNLVQLGMPRSDTDWIILVLLVAILYLVFRK